MSRHNVIYKPGGSIVKPLDIALKMQRVIPVEEVAECPVCPAEVVVDECIVEAEAAWFVADGEDPNSSFRDVTVSALEGESFAFMAGITGDSCQCNHPGWDDIVDGPWVTWDLVIASGVKEYGHVGMFIDSDTVIVYSNNAPGPSPIEYELTASIGGSTLPPINLIIG
ncbi:MAG: hypothetical protein ABIG70_02890 [Pseudomonadota bacterium]